MPSAPDVVVRIAPVALSLICASTFAMAALAGSVTVPMMLLLTAWLKVHAHTIATVTSIFAGLCIDIVEAPLFPVNVTGTFRGNRKPHRVTLVQFHWGNGTAQVRDLYHRKFSLSSV